MTDRTRGTRHGTTARQNVGWAALAAACALWVAFGAGCDKKDGAKDDKATQAGAASSGAVAEAGKIWNDRCVSCHGKSGEGNGPASAGLDPKPRNMKDKEWQEKTTDEHIEKVILGGGTAVGQSALMPPNPDLTDKPEVVAALKDIVRQFGK